MQKEKIEKDFEKALKGKRRLEVSTLRMLKAAVFNKEKEKRYKLSQEKPDLKSEELEKESYLTDEEIFDLLFSEIKKRKEAIELFERGKREDLAEAGREEIEILKRYLPEEISKEDIEKLAREVIEKLGVKDIKGMGRVMAELMPKLKGRVEGSLVNEMVRELLVSK